MTSVHIVNLRAEIRLLEHRLQEYIDRCRRHESELLKARNELVHEMEVSERLNDLNIELKGKIRGMSHVSKVRVHPSAMSALQRSIEDKARSVTTLREALLLAISLIPDDRCRRLHIPGLKKIYQEVF